MLAGSAGLRDPDRFDAWLNRLLLNSVTDEARRRGRYAASITSPGRAR